MSAENALQAQSTLDASADELIFGHADSSPIPPNWRIVRLGDVGTLTDGDWILREDYSEHGVRLLQVGDIGLGDFIGKSSRYISLGRAHELKCTFLRTGDVLISRMADPVGRACMLPELPYPAITAVDVTIFRPDEMVIDANFAVAALNHSGTLAQAESLAYGVTRKRVTRSNLSQVRIPLPPLAQQRAIADILRTVQEAIAARRRELELERERKAALMQHVFTYGTRGEPTKMTDIGEMPESWRVVRLGDLCADGRGIIQTGPFGSQLHASDYKDAGVPVVNPTHLGFNCIVETHLPRIAEDDADRLSRHYLKVGDILIARRGDFSRYSYISDAQAGWLCGTGCLLIRLSNPDADNYFLSVSMSTATVQNYMRQNAVGSIMPNLNTKILEGMSLALPPVEEQHDIASALQACEAKAVTLERETDCLEELFRALLEELMSGRLSTVPLIEDIVGRAPEEAEALA